MKYLFIISLFFVGCTSLKITTIKLSNALTLRYEPYEEFNRPLQEKYPELLEDKAQKFEEHLLNNFGIYNGFSYVEIWNSNKQLIPGVEDIGDQCLWHGIYTAMFSFKYHVTKNKEDLELIRKAVNGMDLHQIIHGEEKRRLIRGISQKGTFEDEVSNDSLTGHLAGIYFSWLYGDKSIKITASKLAAGIADELIENSYSLINNQKKPTEHGKLINGEFTDPLRLTLCLTALKIASELIQNKEYEKRYLELLTKYGSLLPHSSIKFLWFVSTGEAHRVAIHLSILADLEKNKDVRNLYIQGLKNLWELERKSGNPWIVFLVSRHFKIDDLDFSNCIKLLKEMTFEDKVYNIEKINSNKVETVTWGQKVAKQPLPRWQVGAQDFFWQRHLYTLDSWIGNNLPTAEYNGGDFLVCYWGFRLLGLIEAKD